MTYVVIDNCIACKYTDCVEVCPVDCFYEGENMLVIHPDECIDCGVCEPECPADAIRPDTEPDMEEWVTFNRKYSEHVAGDRDQEGPAARGYEERDGETGKRDKYFSEAPGAGRLKPQRNSSRFGDSCVHEFGISWKMLQIPSANGLSCRGIAAVGIRRVFVLYSSLQTSMEACTHRIAARSVAQISCDNQTPLGRG